MFLGQKFKFLSDLCNGCQDVLMMSINLNDIAILSMLGVGYCCIINGIRKSEAVDLLQNVDLSGKSGTLWNIIFLYRV